MASTWQVYCCCKQNVSAFAEADCVEDDILYLIQLTTVQYIGTTTTKWYTFADTQANPVRYLTKV